MKMFNQRKRHTALCGLASPSQNIPIPVRTKRIAIFDPIQMPEVYSTSPGGTLYSITPGGTKLIYERVYLRELGSSPSGRSMPIYTPFRALSCAPRKCIRSDVKKTEPLKMDEQEQFQMDI